MKEHLDDASRQALVAYRRQRAYDTLKEADLMRREGFYNAAVNRLYYACYYAAVALLVKHNYQTQTHSGVKTILGLHFISTGIISAEVGKTFAQLFNKRQSGDYDDFAFCDATLVDDLFSKAQTFIDTISSLVAL